MPPTSIDGTDISSATIDGTEVQEITVDGDVVYQLSTIPDSAVHQYQLDTGSGSTLFDSIGSRDIGIGDGTWVSDATATGGAKVEFLGSDKSQVVPTLSVISENADFAVAATFEITDNVSDNEAIIDHLTSDSVGFTMGHRNGDIGVRDFDNTEHSIPANANTRYRVIGQRRDGNFELKVNGSDETGVNSKNPNNGSSAGFALGGQTTDDGNDASVILDNVIVYNDGLTPTEVQQDYDAQPWS